MCVAHTYCMCLSVCLAVSRHKGKKLVSTRVEIKRQNFKVGKEKKKKIKQEQEEETTMNTMLAGMNRYHRVTMQ